MTTYTEQDFTRAEFARHPDGRIAARIRPDDSHPWYTLAAWLRDAGMADRGWVPVQETAYQPITLDALHAAWETAEVADECNEGDVLITRDPDSSNRFVQFWRSPLTGPMWPGDRILHRAPKPTPGMAERGIIVSEEGEK